MKGTISMKRVFPKIALVLVLLTVLAFLISGTASAQSVATTHQTVTTKTLTHSVATSCPPTLAYGSTGSWVKTLQNALNNDYEAGYFPNTPYNFKPKLKVDGDFGTLTANAVKDFQEWYLLVVDGVVGPKTWNALGYC
jgi:peptidoglycan hydrolase-like protein with peptidoglycan-binding domain